ncbi:von Willebrand factor A domain-containing protein 1 [Hyperolius riggenbachi]|uniref:von Willebrand factor A domain-containing protein 1 n=1 Tax=Hyperolius riggenbachi TaxID=752182 RepID=UPI0035A29B4D
MFVILGLYLHTFLCTALGHTIPDTDQANFIPDSEGDLLFLLDSSGSVTYDEFANVKEFIGDLIRPFKFGPQDVQASVVQISTNPSLEFPLSQYTSSQDIQKAIQKMQQRMGDTNTGKALRYVKEQLYSEKFGSRADVPKVLVWVTDGLSTDDISGPMQLLKNMGVYVFIISTTGRGNFQELSAAASQPDEKYLKFVDKDDLGIITKELRDSIIELIQAKRLHAVDVTTNGFRLVWPRLLSRDTGHYMVEYVPIGGPREKVQELLPGDQTSLVVNGLTPNTTYQVTLLPETNLEYIKPQLIQVSTLQEVKEERKLEAGNITTTGIRLTWSRLSGDTGSYVLEYSPVSNPRSRSQMAFYGGETSAVLTNLPSNTTYQITLISDTTDQSVQPETIQVSTLPDLIRARNLQVQNITSTTFKVTWSRLFGDAGRYFVDYAPLSDPRRKQRKTLYGDQTSVVISGVSPNTTYLMTFTPESSLENMQSQTLQISTLPDFIQSRHLKVMNVTPTGFHLTWSALPGDTGTYTVHYSAASEMGVKPHMLLFRETSAVITDLTPNTSYKVTFTPMSTMQTNQTQTIQVSIPPSGFTKTRNLQAVDITATSLRVIWTRLPEDEGLYVMEYSPISDTRLTQQKILYGDDTSVEVTGLLSNTTYRITLYPKYSIQHLQPDAIIVSTKVDPVQERNLQILDIASTSFLIAWSRLPGDSGRYILEYGPLPHLHGKLQKTLLGDEGSFLISGLTPDTTYQVTLIPESNAPDVKDVTINVSTLPDMKLARNLHIKDKTSTSFQLAWSRLSGDTGSYVIEYAPLMDLGKKSQKIYRDLTSVVFSSLMPNTTYQVTFIPESREPVIQSQTIQVTTLPVLHQIRSLHAWDISTSSFRLTWSRLPTDRGFYVLECSLVSDPQKKMKMFLSSDETSVLIGNLAPDTKFHATLYSESNVEYVPAQSIQISTLTEQVGLAQILISDPTPHSFRVSWGPHLDSVIGYEIQYGLLASNAVQTVQVDSRFNSTVLEGLNPNTTYLVTVSAVFKSGGEKALSAIACTELSGSKVKYLRIEDLQSNNLKAVWGSADGDVQGYQVRCRRQAGHSSVISVAPEIHSVHLTDLPEGGTNKICVKPVYKGGAGKNLCKKVQMHLGSPANSYSRRQSPLKRA